MKRQTVILLALSWFAAAPAPSDRVDMNRTMTEKTEVPQEEASKKKKPERLPFGKPIVGRPGFVLSPYAAEKGPIDVRKFKPGEGVKDPFTGKTFIVPPVRTTGSNL